MLSSYDDGELAKFGPGRAHLHELIRRAIGRALAYFDFTVGDESYKREWSDVELWLYDHTAAAMMTGYRRAKRIVKQTPALWRAFSKARGAVAGYLSKRPIEERATR